MNACNDKFLENKDINFNELDNKIYTTRDINWIVYKYEMQSKPVMGKVSMEDLIGFYRPFDDITLSFPEVLDDFFDEKGDGYHSRAISMLNYDSDTVMEGLKNSFEREPISTFEVDDHKQVIFNNGMHRFLVLRSLYLKERAKCNSDREISLLNDKFTIPVEVTKNDMLKTYCKYLIDIFQPANIMNCYFGNIVEDRLPDSDKKYSVIKYSGMGKEEKVYLNDEEYDDYIASIVSISSEYGDNGPTGKSIIEYFDGTVVTTDDTGLLLLTSEVISSSVHRKDVLEDNVKYNFNELMETYPSFKKFVDSNFKNEISMIKEGVRYEHSK